MKSREEFTDGYYVYREDEVFRPCILCYRGEQDYWPNDHSDFIMYSESLREQVRRLTDVEVLEYKLTGVISEQLAWRRR